MNLVKYLTIGTIFSIIFGELGRFPFGAVGGSISLTDILLLCTSLVYLIWKVSNKERIVLTSVVKWLVVFWVVGLLSLLYSLINTPFITVLQGGLYLMRFILYSSLVIVIKDLKTVGLINFDYLVVLFIKVGVAFGIIGIVQYQLIPNFEGPPFYLTDFGFDPHKNRLTSTFLDPNFAGVFLAIIFFLVMYRLLKEKVKLITKLTSGFLLLAVFLTYSRSAFIALFSSGILLIFSLRKRYQIKQRLKLSGLILLILVLLIIISPRFLERLKGGVLIDESSRERIESWQKGIEIFKKYPILGVGFNNLRYIYQQENLLKVYSEEGGHAGGGVDSSLLFVLTTTGVAGLIIYLGFYIEIFKRLVRQKDLESMIIISVLVGTIIGSQFINGLFYPPLMVTLFSLIGVVSD